MSAEDYLVKRDRAYGTTRYGVERAQICCSRCSAVWLIADTPAGIAEAEHDHDRTHQARSRRKWGKAAARRHDGSTTNPIPVADIRARLAGSTPLSPSSSPPRPRGMRPFGDGRRVFLLAALPCAIGALLAFVGALLV